MSNVVLLEEGQELRAGDNWYVRLPARKEGGYNPQLEAVRIINVTHNIAMVLARHTTRPVTYETRGIKWVEKIGE